MPCLAPSSSPTTYAPLFHLTSLIRQHSQHLKTSRIRKQVCSSFSVLPVSNRRKVVVLYSLLSHPHCPLLDTVQWTVLTHIVLFHSHVHLQLLTLVCCVIPFLILWYEEYLVVQPVKAQYNVLFQKEVCVKYYLLLQHFLLFVLPPTPSCSLPLPLAPSSSLPLPLTLIIEICDVSRPLALIILCSISCFSFFFRWFLLSQDNPFWSLNPVFSRPLTLLFPLLNLLLSLFNYVGVFSHNITHFDHLILQYLSSPHTSHVSLILLTPRPSEIILINGEGVNGVFKEHSIYASAASGIHCCWYKYWFQIILVHKICNWKFTQQSKE